MTTTTIPVEEYLRTTYHPDMEYVDGELRDRHVDEYQHSYARRLRHCASLSPPTGVDHPATVIEIVSPDDEPADLLAKVADYLRFGIPHIWIPDPYKRTLQQADRNGIRDCPSLVVETDLVGQWTSTSCSPSRTSRRSEHASKPACPVPQCDAKIDHMRTATVRDLRYRFGDIENLLQEGEEIQITKRRRVVARLMPVLPAKPPVRPDYLARLRKIYGGKQLAVSGSELLARERERF